MKWPKGFKMPAHLPHALDPHGPVRASYFHADEVRGSYDLQRLLVTMRDVRRGTTARVIAEALPGAELAHGLHPEPERRASPARTPVEMQALGHEILHAIHEQRAGLPKTLIQVARSEWAAHAGSLLGKHGRKEGGLFITRFMRAVAGTLLLTLRHANVQRRR
jgi:hypothetical protein